MRTASALFIALNVFVIAATTAGCGPARLLTTAAPELPAAAAGRNLWNTPSAYVYARDESVAGEADAWVRSLRAHLARTYHGDLGKGFVVVTDENDEPVAKSTEELDRLERLAPSNPAASQPTPGERRKQREESGMTELMTRQIAIVPLDALALRQIGISGPLPADVAWQLTCPSARLARKVTMEFAPAAVEKKKGKAFAILAAPVMPIAVVEAAKLFELVRDTLAFSMWADRQGDWDAAKRSAQTAKYMKERAFVISPMLSLALSIAGTGSSE